MFRNIKNNKINLILLNARLTKKFLQMDEDKRFFSLILKNVTVAFPQNLETKFI